MHLATCQNILQNISRVVVGKSRPMELLLAALIAEGHALLNDVPGVGKTLMAKALARSIGGSFKRVQFTPDLLPADITGFNIYDQKNGRFKFQSGPVISNILLADEINRTVPRTQASLLESMEERQVTVDGVTMPLPRPFFVLATQNPIELEGTFPLPEAQIDRFLMRLALGYPTQADESRILLLLQHNHPIETIKQVATADQLLAAQQKVRSVHVETSVRTYIVNLVRSTRSHADVSLGASPPGSLALFRTSQALAALRGRAYVLPDDVKALAPVVLGHRLLIKPESQLRGRSGALVIGDILRSTPVVLEEEAGA